jgi:acyl carrier protein
MSTSVRTLIARSLRIPEHEVLEETLIKDLVEDSFALIDLVIDLQEELGVKLRQDDFRTVRTVGDLGCVLAKRAA